MVSSWWHSIRHIFVPFIPIFCLRDSQRSIVRTGEGARKVFGWVACRLKSHGVRYSEFLMVKWGPSPVTCLQGKETWGQSFTGAETLVS